MTAQVGNLHPEFRSFWHPVAWSHEVADRPVAVTLLGEPLVAVRRPTGEVAVYVDECPHRGAPLSLGRLEGDELVCAFHGWRFGPDGAATCIPALGPDAPIPSRARLAQPAAVCERYGIVWVALDEPRLADPVVARRRRRSARRVLADRAHVARCSPRTRPTTCSIPATSRSCIAR